MAREHASRDSDTLLAASTQPLIGILADEGGCQTVRYFADDDRECEQTDPEETLRAALAVVGAWSDLDWDALSEDLDRMRHAAPPTPPIEL